MFGLVQNLFGQRRCNPIGVDFGSDSLRLAQVQWAGDEYRLVAAASADVPAHVRAADLPTRAQFLADTTRDLLAQGDFKGRAAVLALPAASMAIQHLRLPPLDPESIKKALPWEARGKLPIDPAHAVLRHLVAGEVYQDSEPRAEVIVMAAARELVQQLLSAASRAKLDVVGMNVEPQALVDCFAHVHRRRNDAAAVTCLVDIGSAGSRAVITRGPQIVFARTIPVGGDHFTRAVASALKVSVTDAKMLRIKLCAAEPAPAANAAPKRPAPPPPPPVASGTSEENSFALLGAAMAAAEKQPAQPSPAPVEPAPAPAAAAPPDEATAQLRAVAAACREPLAKLIEELDLCRRYYEATFPNKPVERLLFVGGEARQRGLCAHIARELGLAAQIGDPMVRMGRISEIGVESGIDRRQPQPAWAVAIGLSMGPAADAGADAGKAPQRRSA
jgi:type IV pilus assembly protein PilM